MPLLLSGGAPEPVLRAGGSGELDEIHAHKASMVFHDGVLYHFSCAVRRSRDGDPTRALSGDFRCITVATSRPLARGSIDSTRRSDY